MVLDVNLSTFLECWTCADKHLCGTDVGPFRSSAEAREILPRCELQGSWPKAESVPAKPQKGGESSLRVSGAVVARPILRVMETTCTLLI